MAEELNAYLKFKASIEGDPQAARQVGERDGAAYGEGVRRAASGPTIRTPGGAEIAGNGPSISAAIASNQQAAPDASQQFAANMLLRRQQMHDMGMSMEGTPFSGGTPYLGGVLNQRTAALNNIRAQTTPDPSNQLAASMLLRRQQLADMGLSTEGTPFSGGAPYLGGIINQRAAALGSIQAQQGPKAQSWPWRQPIGPQPAPPPPSNYQYRFPIGPQLPTSSDYEPTDPRHYQLRNTENLERERARNQYNDWMRPPGMPPIGPRERRAGTGGNGRGRSAVRQGLGFAAGAIGVPLTLAGIGAEFYTEQQTEAGLSRTARTSYGGDAQQFVRSVYEATQGLGLLHSESAALAEAHAKVAGQFKDDADLRSRVGSTATVARVLGVSPDQAMQMEAPFVQSGVLGSARQPGTGIGAENLGLLVGQIFSASGWGVASQQLVQSIGQLSQQISTNTASADLGGSRARSIAALTTGLASVPGMPPNGQAVSGIVNQINQAITQPQGTYQQTSSYLAAYKSLQQRGEATDPLSIMRQREQGVGDLSNVANLLGRGTMSDLQAQGVLAAGLTATQAQALTKIPGAFQKVGTGERGDIYQLDQQALQDRMRTAGGGGNLAGAMYEQQFQGNLSSDEITRRLQEFLGQNPSATNQAGTTALQALRGVSAADIQRNPSGTQQYIQQQIDAAGRNGLQVPASNSEAMIQSLQTLNGSIQTLTTSLAPSIKFLTDTVNPLLVNINKVQQWIADHMPGGSVVNTAVDVGVVAAGIKYGGKILGGAAGLIASGVGKAASGGKGLITGGAKTIEGIPTESAEGGVDVLTPGDGPNGEHYPRGLAGMKQWNDDWAKYLTQKNAKPIEKQSYRIPASEATYANDPTVTSTGTMVNGSAAIGQAQDRGAAVFGGSADQAGTVTGNMTYSGVIRYNEVQIATLTVGSLNAPGLAALANQTGNPVMMPLLSNTPKNSDWPDWVPPSMRTPGISLSPSSPNVIPPIPAPGAVPGASRTANGPQNAITGSILPAAWYAKLNAHESDFPLPSQGAPEPMFGLMGVGPAGTHAYPSAASDGSAPGSSMLFNTVQEGVTAVNKSITSLVPNYQQYVNNNDFQGLLNAMAPHYLGGTPTANANWAAQTAAMPDPGTESSFRSLGTTVPNDSPTSGISQNTAGTQQQVSVDPLTIHVRQPDGSVQQFNLRPRIRDAITPIRSFMN